MQLDARFLTGGAGECLAVHRRPAASQTPRGSLLILPPFGEEMNRTRRFLAVLAERLCDHGIASLTLDVHGTGDSAGEFADATWEGWIGDAGAAFRHLCESDGHAPWVSGVRSGALLGAEAVAAGLPASGLLAIQPVLEGERFLRHLLRTRTMARMLRGERESVDTLRDRLRCGESVEVAGYELSPELATALSERALAKLPAPPGGVLWYELAQTSESSRRTLLEPPASWESSLRRRRVLEAPPFWMIEEPVVPDGLIAAICEDLTNCLES